MNNYTFLIMKILMPHDLNQNNIDDIRFGCREGLCLRIVSMWEGKLCYGHGR
jgi:hypothetical protein